MSIFGDKPSRCSCDGIWLEDRKLSPSSPGRIARQLRTVKVSGARSSGDRGFGKDGLHERLI